MTEKAHPYLDQYAVDGFGRCGIVKSFIGGMFRIDFAEQGVSIYRSEKETSRMIARAQTRENKGSDKNAKLL